MNKNVFTFEKLGINSKEWDIKFVDNKCGYTFSTPSDGILLLKSVGLMSAEIIKKQIHFIENYHIQLNQKITSFKSVLIWDVSNLSSVFVLNQIRKELMRLSVDVLLMIPGKLSFKLFLSYYKKSDGISINLLSANLNEAIAFARRIMSKQEGHDIFAGKFAELWSIDKKTRRIGKRVYRYLELPEWQYSNEDKTFNAKVTFFDNKTIYYEMIGRIGVIDVQVMQQKVATISNQLEIDLKKLGFYVIFDTKKVTAFDPQARKLMRKMEQHQHHLSNGVMVIANPLVKYLFAFRKQLHPNRYDHWRLAKSLSHAFYFIEMRSIKDLKESFLHPSRIEPSSEYNELLDQFRTLQSDYNVLTNNYKRSMSNIRNVLSYVNAGDFLMTPFRPRFGDETIEGEVYNTFALLHDDLKKNRSYNLPQNVEIGSSKNNIESILQYISVPAFIYCKKTILLGNELFAELLGTNQSDLAGQPLVSFIHTYDLNRVERYLEEINSYTSFDCDIYNDQNRTITVTLYSEFMLIDGVYSKLIFIGAKDRSLKGLKAIDIQEKENPGLSNSTNMLNKTTGGVVHLYLAMLKKINNKLFNQYISPESYNPQEGAAILTNLSGYVQKILEGIEFYQTNPEIIQLFSLKESIDGLVSIFQDYLKITKPNVTLNVNGFIPTQKIGIPLQVFWVESILMRILHLIADVTDGKNIDLLCGQKEEKFIEITISDDGANLNLFSLDKVVDSAKGAITIYEIDQLLKRNNCSLDLESTLERGNSIRLTIPILDRGIGYDGSLMDLSYHNILVFENAQEFDTYSLAMKDTGANLIHASRLQEALNLLSVEKISVIFVDLFISEIDLSLFVSRVKNEFEGIPIIGISNSTTYKNWKRNLQSGVDVVLSKPLDSTQLKETIKQFLS
jgi:CheY-like chemotaxis protein